LTFSGHQWDAYGEASSLYSRAGRGFPWGARLVTDHGGDHNYGIYLRAEEWHLGYLRRPAGILNKEARQWAIEVMIFR
jgi:hypothetical protein